MVEGDGDPGTGAVGGGYAVGVQGVLGELDQGVEHAGAVVAGVGLHFAAGGVRVDGGVDGGRGLGEGEQGGAEHGAVLGAAAALDPDPAGAVLGDREEPAGVRGAFLAVEGGLVAALGTVGVDDLGEVSGGAGQLGGVEPPGLLQQHLLAPGSQGRARGQGVDRVADDRGLSGGGLAAAHRLERLGQLGDQLLGVHHGPSPLAAGQAGQVREPVGRGAPVQLLAGQVPGVGLGQQPGLERRDGYPSSSGRRPGLRPGPRRRTRSPVGCRGPPAARGQSPARLRETHTGPRQAPDIDTCARGPTRRDLG